MKIVPGVYFDLPAEDYHAAEGVSQSMLQHMDPPARLPVYLAEKRDVTPWMRMGTLIHAAVLEPTKPLPKLTVQPETYVGEDGSDKPWHNGSKICKHWHAMQNLAGIEVLTKQQYADLTGCVRSIAEHKVASAAFADGWPEVSIFRDVELPSGRTVRCKSRLDWVTRTGDAICDLKKVQNGKADLFDFERLAWQRDLHVQAAFYLDAWNETHGPLNNRQEFVWVVVEEDAPHLVAVHRASPQLIAIGREIYIQRLEDYVTCTETKQWPGYSTEVRTIGIPQRFNSY